MNPYTIDVSIKFIKDVYTQHELAQNRMNKDNSGYDKSQNDSHELGMMQCEIIQKQLLELKKIRVSSREDLFPREMTSGWIDASKQPTHGGWK